MSLVAAPEKWYCPGELFSFVLALWLLETLEDIEVEHPGLRLDCHVVDYLDIKSELELLQSFAPTVPKESAHWSWCTMFL